MKRTILMLLMPLSLAACATTPLGDCEGPASAMHVTVSYGDSRLSANPPVVNVKRKGDFVVRLAPSRSAGPHGIDYSTVNVTIVGQTMAKSGTDNSWITSKTGDASDDPFVWCAPDEEEVYYYQVTVDKVGSLDPRVDVD